MALSAFLFLAIIVVMVTAATAAGANAGVAAATNATAMARRGNSSTAAAARPPNASLQYICYLCHKRDTLMIRWCPLVKDDCHVACLSLPTPSPPAPRRHRAPADRGDDDCYVMKLYPDGSWVIVDVVSCRAVGGCYLVCSYGDAREDAAAVGAGDDTTTAAPRGPPLPQRLAEFQRCGDQLAARGAAVPGV
ncbi:hypothetical protein ACP70R_047379 [Stipagrostis hirtigluma subsp. patula]